MSSSDLQGVQAVLFDAVGTLIRLRRPVAVSYHEFGARHGFDLAQNDIAARFRSALARQLATDAAAASWQTSEASERARWRSIVADVFEAGDSSALDPLFEDLWNYFAEADNWQLYDDVPATWAALSDHGLTLGVASNLDQRLRQIGTGLPVLSNGARLFISSELGYRKPSKDFFLSIQRSLRLKPAQLLLVGDDVICDIQAALACGWQALLLDRTSGDSGTDSIANLRELLAMLSPA